MASLTENKHIKSIPLDIAREEKTHANEFKALLYGMINKKEEDAFAEGMKEVEELVS